MPIIYKMAAVCDGCGKVLEEATVKKSSIDSVRWDWEIKWKKAGVMKQDRAYRSAKIFCQPCADGPVSLPAHEITFCFPGSDKPVKAK